VDHLRPAPSATWSRGGRGRRPCRGRFGECRGGGVLLVGDVLERFTLTYLPEGPAIDWTGEIDAWLDPLAA
jgi:hypothetical protein